MLNGLEILIARMKTHPEEFVLDGRWADLIAKVDKHLTEEERQAVKDGFTGIARDTFNEVIMKAIAGEGISLDQVQSIAQDYDTVMQYPMDKHKAKEQAEKEYQERRLQTEIMQMRAQQNQALRGLSPYQQDQYQRGY